MKKNIVENGVKQDPAIVRFLEKMPKRVANSFSEEQLTSIKTAIGARIVIETKAVENSPKPSGARFLANNNWLAKKRIDESAPPKKSGYTPTKIFFNEYLICVTTKVFYFLSLYPRTHQ